MQEKSLFYTESDLIYWHFASAVVDSNVDLCLFVREKDVLVENCRNFASSLVTAAAWLHWLSIDDLLDLLELDWRFLNEQDLLSLDDLFSFKNLDRGGQYILNLSFWFIMLLQFLLYWARNVSRKCEIKANRVISYFKRPLKSEALTLVVKNISIVGNMAPVFSATSPERTLFFSSRVNRKWLSFDLFSCPDVYLSIYSVTRGIHFMV